jgi:hypothetical protein
MRKHSISREVLWKCVREVQGAAKVGRIVATIVDGQTYYARPEFIGERIPESVIEEPAQWPTTAKQDEALEQILDPERQSDFMKVMENISKLSPAKIQEHFKPKNPFAFLRARRQYKMEVGEMPTDEQLMNIQAGIISNLPVIELSGELQQLILSL